MQNQKFPYVFSKVEGDLHRQVLKDFPFQMDGIVCIGPEKWTLPGKYEEFADQIYNFEARPDDVWICTHPRSGTTWTQEMIWLICNNLDYETALKKPLYERFPFLEFNVMFPDSLVAMNPTNMSEKHLAIVKTFFAPNYDRFSNMSPKRFIKTHYPMKLMPRSVTDVGAKVVYVARNPKDMCVSWYHFHKTLNFQERFNGDFNSFSKYFMGGLIRNSPYWKHVLDGWQNRHLDNVHFMFYEDCKDDLASSLKKLANFLGHTLKDEDLPKLMEHLSFEKFRENSSVNVSRDPKLKDSNHVRRGKVGGNPEITQELSEKFDEWTKKNLVGSDFEFPAF